MKAEDLRIGNWVEFKPDNGRFIISTIDTHKEQHTINGLNYTT